VDASEVKVVRVVAIRYWWALPLALTGLAGACVPQGYPVPGTFVPTSWAMPRDGCANEPISVTEEWHGTLESYPCANRAAWYVAEEPALVFGVWHGVQCFRSERECRRYVFSSGARARLRAERHARECGRGDKTACHALARAYLNGTGVMPDLRRAMAYFRTACDGGVDAACFDLGTMWAEGFGAPKSLETALRYLRKPCDQGSVSGCLRLANMYYEGQPTPRDHKQALVYYQRACGRGDLTGCYNVGVMYRKGHGVARDHGRARAYYGRACRGGYTLACPLMTRALASWQPPAKPATQPASSPTTAPASCPTSAPIDPSP